MFDSALTPLVAFVGLTSGCRYPSLTGETQSGSSSTDAVSNGTEGQGHFPAPAGNNLAVTAQDAVGPVGCKSTLLSFVQLSVS